MSRPEPPPAAPEGAGEQTISTSACPLLGGAKASEAARRHLRTVGADWEVELLAVALLATTELVVNAVTHGGNHASLVVHTSADTIRVEVYDSGHGYPRPMAAHHAEPTAWTGIGGRGSTSGGRGLALVAALSDRWGVTQQPMGKSVWFELGLPARSGCDPPAGDSLTSLGRDAR